MLQEALYYHSLGWSIIPIKTNSKLPAIKWEEYQNRIASTEEVEKWFTGNNYGIGLVCGKISNVLVVDIDEYKKPETLDISSPVSVNTPRGGRHLYFKYSEKIATTVNADLAIDIRSDGGYVLLPPSIHPNGKPYTWGNKELINDLPEVPEVLSKVFTRIEGETFDLQEYLNISEGSRNDSLYKVAVSLLSKHPLEIAIQLISSINLNYNPPLSDNEVQTILKSAQNFVENNPPHKPKVTTIINSSLAQKLLDNNNSQEDFRINSGFSDIDSVVKGFRSGSIYLVPGYEKSGKSSFLAKIASNLIKAETKICYLNTELSDLDFITLLTALHLNKLKDEVTGVDRESWANQYSKDISYFGINELSDVKTGLLDFEKTILACGEAVKSGCKVLIFDNLTTYSTQATDKKAGWEILANYTTRIVNFAKRNKVVCFIVIHTKPDVVIAEIPKAIRSFIESGTPEKVFDNSSSYVRKPTGSDVYGGGASRSQLSGIMHIWRPFQFLTNTNLNSMTQIILESFRDAPSSSIRMTFHGGRGLFTQMNEEIPAEEIINTDYTEDGGIPF